MDEIRKRQKLVGEVVSEKMQKTVVVNVTKKIAHPVYGKYIKETYQQSNCCYKYNYRTRGSHDPSS